jgi:hypothetical protein
LQAGLVRLSHLSGVSRVVERAHEKCYEHDNRAMDHSA